LAQPSKSRTQIKLNTGTSPIRAAKCTCLCGDEGVVALVDWLETSMFAFLCRRAVVLEGADKGILLQEEGWWVNRQVQGEMWAQPFFFFR
jgi:hypothetical protein